MNTLVFLIDTDIIAALFKGNMRVRADGDSSAVSV